MAGYTKLFSDIVRSSVWDEDDVTRVVWITLLALKDRNHFVRGSDEFLLKHMARVDLERGKSALEKLSSPDPLTHTQAFEGRRIERAPGGWFILNGEKYHQMLNKAERDEYNRKKQAEYRERKKFDIPAGSSLRAEVNRRVKNDPITKADEAAMNSKSNGHDKPEYAGDCETAANEDNQP